jgi:hypothetical protein
MKQRVNMLEIILYAIDPFLFSTSNTLLEICRLITLALLL